MIHKFDPMTALYDRNFDPETHFLEEAPGQLQGSSPFPESSQLCMCNIISTVILVLNKIVDQNFMSNQKKIQRPFVQAHEYMNVSSYLRKQDS